MSEVNYDDFCGNWRIFDPAGDNWPSRVRAGARFAVYCQNGSYYYNAASGFLGGMNNTGVLLIKDPQATGAYANGTPLKGGLKGDFGSEGWITFTLNDMTQSEFVVSLRESGASTTDTTESVGILSHGGPHGVPD